VRRDIRNEIWTAVVLVLLLAAVALSAVLLTMVEEDVEPTGTPVDIISNVDDSTETTTPTPTVSRTPTQTETITPTATDTVYPTATDTETPTVTPTTTHTASPTRTETPTATPSRTESPTATPRDSVTPRPKDSLTPTLSPTPTQTPTATETYTPTKTPIPLAAATTSPCTPPSDWTTYTVQYGNTLFSIARAVGSTVGELRTVNCIADADNIDVGDVLAVPRNPSGPVRTGVPQVPDASVVAAYTAQGCTVPASSISAPVAGTRVRGLFTVTGTAALDDFQYYRLEVRPDFTNIYNFYARSEQQVVNGTLGQINAELFDDGLYWVRLTVIDNTGNFIQPCAIPVIFE